MPMKVFFSPDQKPGSPEHGGPEFLVIGKLRKPHGLRGEIIMSVWTDFPERITPGAEVYVGDNHTRQIVGSVRWYRKDMLIALEGYMDREQAGFFRNQIISVRTDSLPSLEEGEFYLHQLIGLQVINETGDVPLGIIESIIETGANDVFLVRSEAGDELLIPDTDEVVVEINLTLGELRVRLLPGLLPPS